MTLEQARKLWADMGLRGRVRANDDEIIQAG
jgi:hypothetical protein